MLGKRNLILPLQLIGEVWFILSLILDTEGTDNDKNLRQYACDLPILRKISFTLPWDGQ